jgi:hypothetical protein
MDGCLAIRTRLCNTGLIEFAIGKRTGSNDPPSVYGISIDKHTLDALDGTIRNLYRDSSHSILL